MPPFEWMPTLSREGVSAEAYDRMPEEICRRIEVVAGRIIASPAASPRRRRITRRLATAIEEAAPAPWQVTTGVDLRMADAPLHNRRPDILVFDGDPDEVPVRPRQVLLVVEVISEVGISAGDASGEYAAAGIPWCWRLRQDGRLVGLDSTKGEFLSIGTYSGALKVEAPFAVTVDLDALG